MTHEEKDIIKPATAIQKVIKSLFSKKQFHHSNIVITFVFKLGGAATPPSPTEYHKRAAEARKDKDMNKDKLTGVEKSIHAAVETFQKNLCREMAKRLDEGKETCLRKDVFEHNMLRLENKMDALTKFLMERRD